MRRQQQYSNHRVGWINGNYRIFGNSGLRFVRNRCRDISRNVGRHIGNVEHFDRGCGR